MTVLFFIVYVVCFIGNNFVTMFRDEENLTIIGPDLKESLVLKTILKQKLIRGCGEVWIDWRIKSTNSREFGDKNSPI